MSRSQIRLRRRRDKTNGGGNHHYRLSDHGVERSRCRKAAYDSASLDAQFINTGKKQYEPQEFSASTAERSGNVQIVRDPVYFVHDHRKRPKSVLQETQISFNRAFAASEINQYIELRTYRENISIEKFSVNFKTEPKYKIFYDAKISSIKLQ